MLDPAEFTGKLFEAGYDFVTGVPCSLLAPLINQFSLSEGWRYYSAANEGLAVGLAAGAFIGGSRPVVFMQNSGLGYALDGLTSLAALHRIPLLLIVSWRGEAGTGDEPQHDDMGRILPDLLRLLGIPFEVLERDGGNIGALMTRAGEDFRQGKSFAIIVKEKTFLPQPLSQDTIRPCEIGRVECLGHAVFSSLPSRLSVIEAISRITPSTAGIVSSTGKMSRELLMTDDGPRNLYVVGSMGLASTVGLGASFGTEKKIVIIDGDGAALMQMGAFPMLGSYGPSNLLHVLLDNGAHESTGGQETVAKNVAFSRVAAGCGFPLAMETFTLQDFETALNRAFSYPAGPVFVHAHVAPGSAPGLPRPTASPVENLRRFRSHLGVS